jgi:hypothetical protein
VLDDCDPAEVENEDPRELIEDDLRLAGLYQRPVL